MKIHCSLSYCVLMLGLFVNVGLGAAETGRALIRHAPSINGTVEGNVHQMTAEAAALNGGTLVTGSWLVPGSPKINLNGSPSYGGTLEGSGSTTPSNYTVKLNGGATLGHIVRRSDPVPLSAVDTVPSPTGSVTVTVSSAGASIDWTTLRNLTLLGGVGRIQMPAGTYGDITANGGSGLTLGVAGATQPSVYNFQNLTLNGNCTVSVLGPVVINLANGFAANGTVGAPGNASLLAINVRSGGVTLNGRCNVYGHILAPDGEVKIEGNGQLIGGLISDELTVLGKGLLKLQVLGSTNQGPSVAITAPVDGSTFTAPASFSFTATASDPDGTVGKVEFFEGTTKLGEVATAPYAFPITGVSVGTHTYFARATDDDGATADSEPVTISVTNPNQPPAVTLTAPADGAIFTSPAALNLIAVASDADGSVGRVEFYNGDQKLGEDLIAPFELTTAPLSAGTYLFTAKAFDNLEASATSAPVTVTIVNPNQPPSVTITAPADGASFGAPASFTLSANAGDADGTVSKVEFFKNGTLVGEDTTAPYEISISALEVGTYDFVARATDNADSATDSAAVRVTAVYVNKAPVVNAGADIEITLPAYASLAGTASDPEGDAFTLEWSQVSGPTNVEFESPKSATTRAAISTPGTYVFRLTASDAGASAFDEVTVTVNASTLVYRTYTSTADFELGTRTNLNSSVADQLQLNEVADAGNFLWVAVSSKGTIVKINTRTGKVEGEYWTSPSGQAKNPSRTTVDLNGAVWCTNRDGNSVVQIGSVESGMWIDKNGNGQPDTSTGYGDVRGWLNTGGSDTNGGVSTAADECIINYVRTSSTGTRHISVDRHNNIWASGTGNRVFDLIDSKLGKIVRSEGPVGYGGYGGLIDHNGVIWSATWGSVLRWDTSKPLSGPQGQNWGLMSGGSQYGMAIGPDGYVWASTYGAGVVYKYAPGGALVGTYTQGNGGAQGITVDRRGHVWVAHSTGSTTVGHIAPNGTWLGNVTVGSGPTGVAVDADGKIWSTNHNAGTVSRIDPNAGPVGADGVTPVGLVDFTSPNLGGNLYNYSDMTGSTLTAPPLSGVWTTIFDSGKTGTSWGSINWHAEICDDAKLTMTVCSSTDGINFTPWRVGVRGQDLDVPNGQYLKLNVLLQRASSGQSPVLYDVTIGEQGYLPDYPFNAGPRIDAAERQAANYGVEANLVATVWDDGLPYPSTLSYHWEKVSGPGTVSFDNPNWVMPTATFSTPGNYVLRLTASDSIESVTRDITVIANTPPTANAGPDLGVREAGGSVNLQGSAWDDGASLNGLVYTWRQVSGPAAAVMADVASLTSQVTFPAVGRYAFELSVSDGWAESKDTVAVRVGAPTNSNVPRDSHVWWPFDQDYRDVVHDIIAQPKGATLSSGFAGQSLTLDGTSSYAVTDTDSNLNVASDGSFTAELWVKSDANRSDPRLLSWGDPEGVRIRQYYDALYVNFRESTGLDHDIGVNGVLPAGQWVHVAITYDKTTGVERIYTNGVIRSEQAIGSFTPQTTGPLYFARPSGSYFKGQLDEVSLYRRALMPTEIQAIYDAGAVGKAPADGNAPPVVDAGPDLSLASISGTVTLNGVAQDDQLPAGTSIATKWTQLSGPGTAQFADSAQAVTTVTFNQPGIYVLRLTADDTMLQSFDSMEVRVASSSSVGNIPGLALWWPCNSTFEEVLAGRDAQPINGVSFVTGKVSQAYGFDGVNDYTIVPDDAVTNIGSDGSFTAELWVKSDENRSDPRLVSWGGTVEGVRIRQYYDALYVNFRNAAGGDHDIGINGVLPAGQWVHVAISYDKTTGVERIYTNGVIRSEQAIGSFIPQTTGPLYFARPSGSYFKGQLDEISLYRRALLPTEIQAIYSAGVVGKAPVDGNTPPVVDAGLDHSLASISGTVFLSGAVQDDQLPAGATIATKWTQLSGPGTAQFADSAQAVTTVTFDQPGIYVLRLTADDTMLQSFDSMEVRVASSSSVGNIPGLALWWPCNSTFEEVLAGRDAQPINGVSFVTGKVSQAYGFDGVNDYTIVPDDAVTNIASEGSFTAELWVKSEQNRSDPRLVSWGGTVEGVRIRQYYDALYVNFRNAAGGDHDIGINGVLPAGQWVHVAISYDKSTGVERIYTNGVIRSEQAIGSFIPQTTGPLYFARPSGSYFYGQLDEISLYRRALLPTEIQAIYSAGVVGKAPVDGNAAPLVDAGNNASIASTSGTVTLGGLVEDDELPIGATVSTKWSQLSGPGTALFVDPAKVATTVTFDQPGIYVLRLTADDTLLQSSDTMEVRVASTSGVGDFSGLALWWPCNSTFDEVLAGRDAQPINGVSFTTGKVSEAYTFDGLNDYAIIPGDAATNIASDGSFTAELWVKSDENRSDPRLVSWGGTVEGVRIRQYYDALYVNFRNAAGGDHDIGVNGVLPPGQWVHVAISYDKSTGVERIYTNGVIRSEQAIGSFIPQTTGPLYFARPSGSYFKGQLDEISLYRRALLPTEIQTLYNTGVAGKDPMLINTAPQVSVPANTSVSLGVPLALMAAASDDGLPNPPAALTYLWEKVSGPGNIAFTASTALQTEATFDAEGSYTLRFSANDSARSASADFTVTVTPPPPTVAISSPLNGGQVVTGYPTTILVTAASASGTVTKVEIFKDGASLGLAGKVVGQTGVWGLQHTFGATASAVILVAKATDDAGRTSTSAQVTVTVAADPGISPFVEISSPSDGAGVTAPTTIVGTVTSPILASYTLEYRASTPANDGSWVPFATGATAVVSGPLGIFDPTLLLNGSYEIRLSGQDQAGRITRTTPVTFVVDGNMKIGAFSLAFEDLKLPLAGIPITLTRTYDSRDPSVGDFGSGWRLALNNVRVQKNIRLAEGWEQLMDGVGLSQVFHIEPTRKHLVTVTFPDGETHRFEAGIYIQKDSGVPLPDNYQWTAPITSGRLVFKPIGDTTSTLGVDGDDSSNFSGHVGEEHLTKGFPGADDEEPWEPTRFRLTTKDGSVYILDEHLGLLELRDLTGNKLNLQRDAQDRVSGIVSTQAAPSGTITQSVVIHRDATGRVDYIADPANRHLDYLYDAQGRLASFTDRESNTTQFRYENPAFPYYLTKIIDPRGIAAMRIEFDASGRMIKQIDADGKETIFTRSIDGASRYEKVKDRLGKETTFYYDDRGNVTLKIDPLGAQTSYVYYPDSDWVKYETDHYGNVKSTARDSQGNITVETTGASVAEDPANPTTGHTTRMSYNSFGAPTQITDPDGRVQKFTYDAATGNLLTHTIGFGGSAPATTTYTYNADGTPYTITDALGNVTTNTYNYSFSSPDYTGAVKQTTVTVKDSAATLLRTSKSVYDAQENLLATITTRSLPAGGTEDIVTRYLYDSENRLKATVMPDGRVTETRYTSFGQVDKSVLWKSLADYQAHDDSAARVTSYGYDNRGNQNSTTYPDGSSESSSFDLENRREWSQDRLVRQTNFQYDDVGRLRFTIQPDATPGNLADNPYTETVYDLVGRATDTYDELRHRTTITYYSDGTANAGRRKQSIQVLSTGNLITGYQYDSAGNVRYVTDPRGNTVETQYDDHGRPTKVVYPATDEHPSTNTATTYDLLGRRIAVTDQEGKVTRYRYDGLGRLFEVRQYADQSMAASDSDYSLSSSAAGVAVTRYGFDEVGNKLSQADARGNTTGYRYDSLGRRTQRILPDSTSETLQYDSWGNLWKRTDFAGKTTTFGYDVLDRLKSKTADATHPSLVYGHAIARIEYDYDADGARTAARTYNTSNTQLYSESTPRDERGRLNSKTTAAGALSYTYYANSLLEDVVSSNAAGVNLGYRYDDANRLAFVDDASTGTVSTTGYLYNANGSLATVTTPNAVAHAYSYDSLNRLRTLNVTKTLATLRSYEYQLHASGHRKKIVETPGRTLDYDYDGLNRLTSETSAGGTVGTSGTIGYTLDKVGNRQTRASTVTALASQSFSFNTRDQLDSDTYDLNGNTTVSIGITAQPDVYDFEDRLIIRRKPDGSTINLGYDADGIRIQKTVLDSTSAVVSTSGYLVDTNNLTGYAQVVEESKNTFAGTTSTVYAYGSDLLSQSVLTPGATVPVLSYFTYDGLGSVRQLTNASGVVTDTWDYDAFGNVVSRTGTTDNVYLYRGEQFDADLGMYSLRARFYNQATGRFWNQDSYEGSSGDPASLHKYLYANADPVMRFDPSGRFSMGEIQQVMFVVNTLARIALPNVVRFGITVAQRVAASLLRPFFVMAGSIPMATQMGQRLSPWDKFQRFFITPTQTYPGVANWLRELFQRMGVSLNQHHVFIQQAWYRAGSSSQWYPGETAANLGMMRLGNAGFNLLAIPSGLNRAMGAATTEGAVKTAAFATATAGSVAMAMEYVWDIITSPFEDEQPTPTPPQPPNP